MIKSSKEDRIPLFTVVSKIFEKVARGQVTSFLTENLILHYYQSRLKKNHSTDSIYSV